MFKKYLPLVSSFLLLAIIFSLWFYPFAAPALGIAVLLFILAVSILPMVEKHKTLENSRSKIIREIIVLVLTILLIAIIGGIAGLLAGRVAGAYVEARWQGLGMAAGLVSAIIVSFAVGYAVRWGVGKLGGG